MNANRFDDLFRSFSSDASPSRRGVLAGLTSGLAAVLPFAVGGGDAGAKSKKKKGKKKKKPQPQPLPSPPPPSPPPPFNAFGCLDVGQPCQGDSTLCCSGICEPSSSTCVAHNSGICFADSDTCTLGQNVPCNPSKPFCVCTRTTGNAGFCGDFTEFDPDFNCRLCGTDTDCQEEFGAGAACLILGGACTPFCAGTGLSACVPPCA